MTDTRSLTTPAATLAYDVLGPLPPTDRPALMLVAAPMTAEGFTSLATGFGDRTVITYDPRGLGRSTRHDHSTAHTPEQNAEDMHRIIAELGIAPVDLFASSGGAVSALALVAAYPDDVATLVAHEPPMLALLPDADRAFAAEKATHGIYHEKGWGHGMASFIALSSWKGELTDEFAAAPPPDPSAFGLPSEDDGSRDDPLLSGVSDAITAYEPDVDAVLAAPTRIVLAVGADSAGLLTDRTTAAVAGAFGQEPVVFPGGHGGFLGGEFGQQGDPEAFAVRLREVLDET
ncbi:alpha/beta hydrolase [Mumia sp. zg.B53]|uniref:alpha/beta fold hydrolase n=1 Tax=Mumia sp. zg.B53 TaxID=2855449 RepID=UPI001C6EC164|nr:alpha/beta hydrolase [Mumia sp. zg.B53]MBW9214698.1 alpha/beta hydrolase [Mumia sp. zg.B53]